jgi:hypothetical protein
VTAFFFFAFGDGSLGGDFFGFTFVDVSGLSFGAAEESDSAAAFFFAFDFGFGEGVGDFFFLPGEVFGFGVGDSSLEFTACAFRTGFSSSVGCA